MKILLLLFLMAACTGYVWAAANSPVLPQRDTDDSKTVYKILSLIGADGIFFYDNATKTPKLMPLGSGFAVSGGALTVSGTTGPAGPTGATGLTGEKGDTGNQGIQGIQGLQGIQGIKGDTGLTGANGTNGTNGTNATTTTTATTGVNGLMSSTDKSKLDAVASGATANDTDANLKARANHTGTQPVATISGNAYLNTAIKNGVFPIVKSGAVAGGTVTYHLTADGLANGAALCSEVIQESVQPIVNDAAASYQIGWAFSNALKTLTLTVNRLGTANILTGVLGQVQAANGTNVNTLVLCR